MKKFLKNLVFLLLLVILPVTFSACKKNSVETSDNSPIIINGGGSGENGGEPQAAAYVIDDAEADELISKSGDTLNTFVGALNSSNLLANNEYPEGAGDKTYTLLNYAYYPKLFLNKLEDLSIETIELNRIYGNDESTYYQYFQAIANDENDRLCVRFIRNDSTLTGSFLYLFYDFAIDEGDITNLNMAFMSTGNNSQFVEFGQLNFDYKNNVLELYLGKILFSGEKSSREFFEENFTQENFANIGGEWAYSLYERFDFKLNTYACNYTPNLFNNDVKQSFEKFAFIDAYDKYDYCLNTPNAECVWVQDIFTMVSSTGTLSYKSSSCTFEENT